MSGPALSDRTRRILATLVRSYIETGEPVASATLAQKAGLNLSSATVRNVLAQLEDMGYVWQPHTSAGRVPTDAGYRCYVDMLLDDRRTTKDSSAVEARLRQEAGDAPLMDDLLSSTSHVLSEASKGVGFAIAPPNAQALFQRIEFVPLSGSRILVVMVASGNQVSQKTVDIGEVGDQLRAGAGRELPQLGIFRTHARRGARRRRSSASSRSDRCTINCWAWRCAWPAARSRISTSPTVGLHRRHLDAASKKWCRPAASPRRRCAALWRMVEEKQRLVRMLNEYIDGPGLTVVIGAEHSDPELRPFSLIAATYFDGRSTGTVGVIGPTRMRYSKAISVVDIAAHGRRPRAARRQLRSRLRTPDLRTWAYETCREP